MSLQPPHNAFKARSIRESVKASEQLAGGILRWPRVEDAWLGYTWRLARGPEDGYLVDGGARIMKFPSFEDFTPVPEISVLYTFDDDHVDIIAVRFVGEEEKRAAEASGNG